MKPSLETFLRQLDAVYPGSEVALGLFSDKAYESNVTPFRLVQGMTTPEDLISVIETTYTGREADDTLRTAVKGASYGADFYGEAALDAAFFCNRDAGFDQTGSFVKIVVVITDGIPRLPYFDGSPDESSLTAAAAAQLDNPTFTWAPWTPTVTTTEDVYVDWISTNDLSGALVSSDTSIFAITGTDQGFNDIQPAWINAMARLGQSSSHVVPLSEGYSQVLEALEQVTTQAACERNGVSTTLAPSTMTLTTPQGQTCQCQCQCCTA